MLTLMLLLLLMLLLDVDVVVEKKKTQSFDKRPLKTRMTKSLPRSSESKKPKFKQLQIID